MGEKKRGCITGIRLNAPVFQEVSFTPGAINYFYGRNGTGKSTFARSFQNGQAALTWQRNPIPPENILVFNAAFVRRNIQAYGNMPGVFTISEINAEKKRLADQKTEEKRQTEEIFRRQEDRMLSLQAEQEKEETKILNELWEETAKLRKEFQAILPYLSKKKLLSQLEQVQPKPADLSAVRRICTLLSNPESQTLHREYQRIEPETLPESDLLSISIKTRSSTDFALFARALGNLDWISKGHALFHDRADGKCPYCGQKLPDDFEEQLASCFDEQYRKDREDLNLFAERYRNALNAAGAVMKANISNPEKSEDARAYEMKYRLFLEKGKANMAKLHHKLEAMEEVIELEDLSRLIREVNALAGKVNADIRTCNALIQDSAEQKQKMAAALFEQMAYDCAGKLVSYRALGTEYDHTLEKLRRERDELNGRLDRLSREAARLNSETVSTRQAMNEINAELRAAGFREFELREKPDVKDAYELIRRISGKAVPVHQDLSEGERQFVAFCYFCSLAKGSLSDMGTAEDKIVIMDDPANGLDGNTKQIMASMIRKMAEGCWHRYKGNEGDGKGIAQMFLLSHDAQFFHDCSFFLLHEYEYVSFFELVRKTDHSSQILLCERKTKDGMVNVSPVRTHYDALWHQYLTSKDAEAVILAAEQILETYFIELCGYQERDVLRAVLSVHRNQFVKIRPDGTEDLEDLLTAEEMLSLLKSNAEEAGRMISYIREEQDPDHPRRILERIFTVLRHRQHYEKMTGIRA